MPFLVTRFRAQGSLWGAMLVNMKYEISTSKSSLACFQVLHFRNLKSSVVILDPSLKLQNPENPKTAASTNLTPKPRGLVQGNAKEDATEEQVVQVLCLHCLLWLHLVLLINHFVEIVDHESETQHPRT